MTVDDQAHELTRGDAILIDPHEIHRMSNHCGEAVEYIVFGVSTEQDGKNSCGTINRFKNKSPLAIPLRKN